MVDNIYAYTQTHTYDTNVCGNKQVIKEKQYLVFLARQTGLNLRYAYHGGGDVQQMHDSTQKN